MWTKTSYGRVNGVDDKAHWNISNGQLQFEVHQLIGLHGMIVTPEQSEKYADHIVRKLNEPDSIDYRP